MSNSKKSVSVLILDQDDIVSNFEGITIYWRSYTENIDRNVYSIPNLVEKKSDQYRKEYLSLVHQAGEAKIKNRRLIDWFEIRPDFSFWWMSLIVENNYGKSSDIPNRIKFFALIDLLSQWKIESIELRTENESFAKAIKSFCRIEKIQLNSVDYSSNFLSLKTIRKSFPFWIQAFLFLFRFFFKNWRLSTKGKKLKNVQLIFFSYFLNFEKSLMSAGIFSSDYWGKLISELKNKNIPTRWFHFYVPNEIFPSIDDAKRFIHNINDAEGNQLHSLIEDYLSLSLLLRTIWDFLKVYWISLRIGNLSNLFKYQNANLEFLYKKDLNDSFRGPSAMLNCLYVNLFSVIVKEIENTQTIFYLQENQSWEIALVYFLKLKKAKVIGVPHATIRYWDLRYFYDPRSYNQETHCKLPLPDKVAINGNGAKSQLLKTGFTPETIIDVETLRYLFLNKIAKKGRRSKTNKFLPYRMLILGDYLRSATHKQMRVFADAFSKIRDDYTFTVKPHPICPISNSEYPDIKFDVTASPLVDILDQFDLVYTSNITSAAVDAYCAGLPVISFLDGETLNMSPLRGSKNVFFVSNSVELIHATSKIHEFYSDDLEPFFNLEEDIPKWRAYINLMIKQDGLL